MKKIYIINGPNINFTGIREKEQYGKNTFEQINKFIADESDKLGVNTVFFQSNHEGNIIDTIQKCYYEKVDGIIINPGAFTHYSYALKDAISSVSIPTIEIHMSNIHKREEFRKNSVTASSCIGQISGFGYYGYILALHAMCKEIDKN